MPYYDYVCSNCGHEIEVVHSVHGHGPAACPNCHGQMRKAISAPAVHFKGTGWARTGPADRAGRVAANGPKSNSSDGAPQSQGASSGESPSKDQD